MDLNVLFEGCALARTARRGKCERVYGDVTGSKVSSMASGRKILLKVLKTPTLNLRKQGRLFELRFPSTLYCLSQS